MRSRINLSTVLIASAAMGAVFYLAAIRMTGQATQTAQATRTASQPARAARTADGHPNLNGIWQATTTANWDLLAHPMRPAVAQPGVYPDVPVLAAPVLALGSVGGVPPGPGVVEGNMIPYKPEAAATEERQRRTLAGPRSGGSLLYARNSPGHVYAVSLSDHPGHE